MSLFDKLMEQNRRRREEILVVEEVELEIVRRKCLLAPSKKTILLGREAMPDDAKVSKVDTRRVFNTISSNSFILLFIEKFEDVPLCESRHLMLRLTGGDFSRSPLLSFNPWLRGYFKTRLVK